MTVLLKKLLFKVRWFAMSDRQKYGYLWIRTVDHLK
jgi:hypothetical protein